MTSASVMEEKTAQNAGAESSQSITQDPDEAPWKRMRYVTTFMMAMVAATAFCMRVTLSIAIVAMTNNSTNPDFPTYEWDLPTQSMTLSSFFWGYVVTNVPAAVIITKYGARWVLLTAMLLCSLATYLTPYACELGGWQALCGLRILQGLTQGTVFPAINFVIGRWAPPHERGRLGSLALAGIQVGCIVTLPISGHLAEAEGGWPSIFYTFATVGLVWCAMWLILGYDTPAYHPYISQREMQYILSFHAKDQPKQAPQTPWKAIATSLPVISLVISHGVFTWGFYMILSEMPTYMHYILKYSIKDNGLLACLPYVVMLVLTFVFGWISDFIVKKEIFKLVTARKLFNTIGCVGPMLAMVGLCYVGAAEKEVAVLLLVLSAGLNAAVFLGFQVSHLDLSPNFAGITMGLANGIGNCMSIVVPLAVGAIVKNEENVDDWRILFWMTAGFYIVGTLIFIVFGKATVQDWNEPKTATDDIEVSKNNQESSGEKTKL